MGNYVLIAGQRRPHGGDVRSGAPFGGGTRDQLFDETPVIDDAPYVYLYQTKYLLPMRANVRGFVFNPMLQGIYNLADMTKTTS